MYSNYLLFMVSLSQQNPKTRYYKGSRHTDVFSGLQTNIAPSKYLQAILAVEGECFEKIIMLCTKEVREQVFEELGGKTTIAYYKQQIMKHAQDLGIALQDEAFSVIPYDSVEADDVAEMLNPIMAILETTLHHKAPRRLYIDFTGGTRTASMALVFAARFLAAQDIETANIVYANLVYGSGKNVEQPAPIEECIRTYDTFDYFAGLVEQEATGSTRRLLEYSKKYGDNAHIDLLEHANRASIAQKSGQIVDQIDQSPIVTGNRLLDTAAETAADNTNADKWEQINKAVERKDFLAFNMFSTNVARLMSACGKLEYIGRTQNTDGSDELYANYLYYNTYLTFIKPLLERLISSNDSPVKIASEYTAQMYKLSHYFKEASGNQVYMNNYMTRVFKERCVEDIKENQEFLTNSIKSLINSGAEISREIVVKLVDQYNSDLVRMQGLYFTKGFPFACMYNRSVLLPGYDNIYKKALSRVIKDLDNLYSENSNIPGTAHLRAVYKRIGIEKCMYEELLKLAASDNEVLLALFPVQYNIKNFVSRLWDKPIDVAEFLQVFMPLYCEMRLFRNRVTHANQASPEEIELALGKLKQCMEMLRPSQEG